MIFQLFVIELVDLSFVVLRRLLLPETQVMVHKFVDTDRQPVTVA